MTTLTRDEISALPLILLLDPVSGRAVAYDSQNNCIGAEASAELVAYAKARAIRDAAYDPERVKRNPPDWRVLPAWAQEAESRLRVVWCRNGEETEAELMKIPTH